jgi:hypothetical protein
MPKVMGLDLGVELSWAYGELNARPVVKTERLRLPHEDNMVAAGYLAFKLKRFFESDSRPDLVVFEKPWVQGQFADVAELFVGLKAAISIMGGFYNVRCVEVAPASISKFALGKGRWTKEEGGRPERKRAVQQWAVRKEFLRKENLGRDGMADAIMCWFYSHKILGVPEIDWQLHEPMRAKG